MKVDITQTDNQVMVTLDGRLDTVTSSEFEKSLAPYFSNQGVELILDCASMEYISSAGLRVVLMIHKTITGKGGRFNPACPRLWEWRHVRVKCGSDIPAE